MLQLLAKHQVVATAWKILEKLVDCVRRLRGKRLRRRRKLKRMSANGLRRRRLSYVGNRRKRKLGWRGRSSGGDEGKKLRSARMNRRGVRRKRRGRGRSKRLGRLKRIVGGKRLRRR